MKPKKTCLASLSEWLRNLLYGVPPAPPAPSPVAILPVPWQNAFGAVFGDVGGGGGAPEQTKSEEMRRLRERVVQTVRSGPGDSLGGMEFWRDLPAPPEEWLVKPFPGDAAFAAGQMHMMLSAWRLVRAVLLGMNQAESVSLHAMRQCSTEFNRRFTELNERATREIDGMSSVTERAFSFIEKYEKDLKALALSREEMRRAQGSMIWISLPYFSDFVSRLLNYWREKRLRAITADIKRLETGLSQQYREAPSVYRALNAESAGGRAARLGNAIRTWGRESHPIPAPESVTRAFPWLHASGEADAGVRTWQGEPE